MRREVRYQPLPSQWKFHSLDTRFKGFSGPVGSGKTAALDQEALRLAYVNSGRLGLIGAPTYTMLRDVTRMKFLECLEENGIPHEFKKADNEVRLLECNSRIIFRSLDQPTRLVGTNLAWFCLDELTYSKRDSWRRMVARLRDPKARELRGCAVWTPRAFDWVYDLFIKPGHDDAYGAIQAKPFENRHVGGRGYYESLEKSYDDKFYRQEALGEYLSVFAGQVYYAFDRRENVKPVEFDPHFALCWTIDFNRDPACSLLCQIVDVSTDRDRLLGQRVERLRVIEEMALPDTPTEGVVREFARRLNEEARYAGKVRAVEIYGDATGTQKKADSKKANWDQVRDMVRDLVRDVRVSYDVPSSNPLVSERVVVTNGALRNKRNERRIEIDPQCQELIADLEQVTWKESTSGMSMHELSNNGDKKRTHTSDALGYLAYRRFRTTTSGPKTGRLF